MRLPRSKTLGNVLLVMRLQDKRDRPLWGLLVVLRIWFALVMTINAFWIKLLVDAVVRGDRGAALLWCAMLALTSASNAIAGSFARMASEVVGERLTGVFEREVLTMCGTVPGLEHHENPTHADRIAALQGQVAGIAAALDALAQTVGLVFRSVATLALLATLHPALLVLPFFAYPSLLANRRAQHIKNDAITEAAATGRLATHLLDVLTSAQASKELRVFGMAGWLQRRDQEVWEDVTRIHATANIKAGAISLLGWLPFAAAYAGALVFMTTQVLSGHASLGDAVLVIAVVSSVNGQVANAVGATGQFIGLRLALENYRWLAAYAAEAKQRETTSPVPARLEDGIVFDDVSFTYPGTEAPVLADVNLRLPAGSTVAVVGENGAGKSTLVKLLAGFYAPTSGAVLVDGVDLKTLDPVEWRTRLSGAFQDFARFEFTIREVVGIGDLPKIDDAEAVTAALARAGSEELAEHPVAGLETNLGMLVEDGTELSGGQWQKLALGRAMMRAEPLLLLLDEPTASLDPHSEDRLFSRYREAARAARERTGGITVLVSHRFSTVTMADLIVVVDQGRIVESGSHQELLGADGLYAELFKLQARSYSATGPTAPPPG